MTVDASYRNLFLRPGGPAAELDAPELGAGAKVHIRRLSARDAEALASIAKHQDIDTESRLVQMLTVCACDPEGNPAFDGSAESNEIAARVPVTLIRRMVDETVRLNAPDDGVKDAKKD